MKQNKINEDVEAIGYQLECIGKDIQNAHLGSLQVGYVEALRRANRDLKILQRDLEDLYFAISERLDA